MAALGRSVPSASLKGSSKGKQLVPGERGWGLMVG